MLVDKCRFAEIVARIDGWVSTEHIVALCDEGDFWTEEFSRHALLEQKKTRVRNLIASIHTDANGREIEFLNLSQQDESGQDITVYKQLDLFEIDDFVQVVRDRYARYTRLDKEIRRLVQLAVNKFGSEAQLRLEFAH